MLAQVPTPSAAWRLDGSALAFGAGVALALHGHGCNWTDAGSALWLPNGCYAQAEHSVGMSGVGAGSLSVCARVRTASRGAALVSKGLGGGDHAVAAGFAIEVGEERGLGVGLADRIGVSLHEAVSYTHLTLPTICSV